MRLLAYVRKKLYLCSAKVVPTNIGMIIGVDLEILTINC